MAADQDSMYLCALGFVLLASGPGKVSSPAWPPSSYVHAVQLFYFIGTFVNAEFSLLSIASLALSWSPRTVSFKHDYTQCDDK